ncbi:hypothetical protein GCM10009678_58840 [Actinomadura kijaniata]
MPGMSNNTPHDMAQMQPRVAGRYATHVEEQHVPAPPQQQPLRIAGKELDPAVAGLVAWLPPIGGRLSTASIERWTEAARMVLTLAHADDGEEGKG